MKFTERDIELINKHGLSVDQVLEQLIMFRQGIPFVNLEKAATIGSGINKISKADKAKYIDLFERNKDKLDIVKFVPASGAATRMFKFLFQFLEEYDPNLESVNSYIKRNGSTQLITFLEGSEQLPFYEEVSRMATSLRPNYKDLSKSDKCVLIIKTILDEDKLNFSSYPKGLLPFHKYEDRITSAFEEHLFESECFALSRNEIKIHFTITESHNHKFNEELERVKEFVEEKTRATINVSFSNQKRSTDTIAVSMDNEPFRSSEGNLLFRPSGHGALLENLNGLEEDIVFIKNIDNVVVRNSHEEIGQNKKILVGVLLEVQDLSFRYMDALNEIDISERDVTDIANFLSKKMNIVIDEAFVNESKEFRVSYLRDKLNRPIRVCGMVKNEGEPGGGPFWVKEDGANISLQIIESAQIDKMVERQHEILNDATHFNPVDLVCSLKDHEGKAFDLTKFVDPKTAFISTKTIGGNDIKALELPGLWNGSMANWNTIFVEVPLITFNPVKTVNDLLKIPHQAS